MNSHVRVVCTGKPASGSQVSGESGVSVSAWIANFEGIRGGYGIEAARDAESAAITSFFGKARAEFAKVGWRLDAVPGTLGRFMAEFSDTDLAEVIDILSLVCCSVAVVPVSTGAGPVLPRLCIECTQLTQAPGAYRAPEGVPQFTSLGANVIGGQASYKSKADRQSSGVRLDMALATKFVDALAEVASAGTGQQVVTCWQPVIATDNPAHRLYYRLILMTLTVDGRLEPASGYDALARLGLLAQYEHELMCRVLLELEAHETVNLGVTISAATLCMQGIWSNIFKRLQNNRSLATRMFVEIADHSEINDLSSSIKTIDRLRLAGCKIVVSGFGAGHASVRRVMAFRPHVVQLSEIFAALGIKNDPGRNLLKSMVGVAEALGAAVIVSGVDTVERHALAAYTGAAWITGQCGAGPSVGRPWRHSDSVLRPRSTLSQSQGPI